MIKDFTPRLYQETILASSADKNTLVVLPTGLGKTNIFLMLAAHRLKLYPDSKILFIGPTRPLIDQYLLVFKKHFDISEQELAVFTGFVKPEKRAELWKTSKIIFSTPQGLENDIISNRINLKDVSLLGVDEAHRAVKDYAYVFVAQKYHEFARHPRIIGLTASPGSDKQKIKEVCQNLFIENLEVRTFEDQDVRHYIQEIKVTKVSVELPKEFLLIKKYLETTLNLRIKKLKSWGILRRKNIRYVNKTDLLKLQSELHKRISSGERDFVLWTAVSTLAEVMKLHHALELLETQGIFALKKYFEKLVQQARTTKVKAVKRLVKDPNFKTAFGKTLALHESGVEHPKLIELKKIIKNNIDKKVIVFTQYRDSATKVVKELTSVGASANIFVGQMKKADTGMSQKEQKKMLDDFRNNEFNVLVATSIGEEGLDVPEVDLVIFYEPIPSAIRHIQRRGRTGRQKKGEVIILMTKGTRDEAYSWSAYHKQRKMYRILDVLKKELSFEKGLKSKNTKHVPLTNFVDISETMVSEHAQEPLVLDKKKTKIIADSREKGSRVIKELINLGKEIELKRLGVADYVISKRVGVELKTVEDFVNSIIDKRMLEQTRALKDNFEKPLLIIEGTKDIYSVRKIHPNAIRGMLASISINYGIPIIRTKNPKETAALLSIIAKRELEAGSKSVMLHEKKPLTLKQQQEYIISSLPGIGPSLAEPLLKEFRTVKGVMTASEHDLKNVKLIGKKKAKEIKRVAESQYED